MTQYPVVVSTADTGTVWLIADSTWLMSNTGAIGRRGTAADDRWKTRQQNY